MKSAARVLLLLCVGVLSPASSQDRGLGLGIVIGSPTGISAKYWASRNEAMQFGLGWTAARTENNAAISFDYLWHSFSAIRSTERLPLFYGVGVQIVGSSAGVRGVAGIAWFSRRAPVDIFLQFVPILQFSSHSGLYLDAGIGVRYFF